MTNRISIIFLFVAFMCTTVQSQSCIGTVMLDDKPVCISHILNPGNSIRLSQLKDSLQEREDIQLLYKYYNTTSYESYKRIYSASDWYGLPEADYLTWMDYMRGKDIQVESVVSFTDHNTSYSCIQFYIVADGFYDRLTFLCKKINNFWYPSSQADELTFAYEKGFFRCVRPQLLSYLLEHKESVITRADGKTVMLREKVMKDNKLDARALLMDRKAITSFRSDEYIDLYFNLDERVDPESWYNADRQHDGAFMTYMDSLQVPAGKKDEIMGLIQNMNYLTAAARLAKFQGIESNTPTHTTAIRRIYGEDRLIEIVAKSENE